MLWLLASAALAADDAAVGEAIRAASEATAGSVVVCPAGERLEREVTRVLRQNSLEESIVVERVPLIGTLVDETKRVMEERDVACGILVRDGGEDEPFRIDLLGTCDRAASTGAVPPVVVPSDAPAEDPIEDTAPTEDTGPVEDTARMADGSATTEAEGSGDAAAVVAPMSMSTRDDAVAGSVDASPRGPVVASPVVVADKPPPRPLLVVSDLVPDPDDFDSVDWHVVDERGVSWPTVRFAQQLGDVETLDRLAEERRQASKQRKIMTWTGVGLMLLSPTPLLFAQSGSYDLNRDLGWTSVFIASSGGLVFGVRKASESHSRTRQRQPAWYYPRPDGEALVAAYNTTVLEERGLLPSADDSPAEPTPAEDAPAPAEDSAEGAVSSPSLEDTSPDDAAPGESLPQDSELDAVVPVDDASEAEVEDEAALDDEAEPTPDPGAEVETPPQPAAAPKPPLPPADDDLPEGDDTAPPADAGDAEPPTQEDATEPAGGDQ